MSLTIDDRVQNVPDVTASGSLAYRRPITASLALIGRVDTNYVGSRIDTTVAGELPAGLRLTNVRAGVEGRSIGRRCLFVNNVTNRMALLTNSPAINVNVPAVQPVATVPSR